MRYFSVPVDDTFCYLAFVGDLPVEEDEFTMSVWYFIERSAICVLIWDKYDSITHHLTSFPVAQIVLFFVLMLLPFFIARQIEVCYVMKILRSSFLNN